MVHSQLPLAPLTSNDGLKNEGQNRDEKDSDPAEFQADGVSSTGDAARAKPEEGKEEKKKPTE